MKKSLNKVIVTLAAVAALAMGTTAMAAVTTEPVSVADGKVKFEVTSTATTVGEQVTLLMLKSDADITDQIDASEIAYIDQAAAVAQEDGSVAAVFEANIALTDEEKAAYEAGEAIEFAVMSGNEAGTLAEGEGVIGDTTEDIHYGDVNSDEYIDGKDSMQILLYTIGKGSIYVDGVEDADAMARANVNMDKTNEDKDLVDGKDSMQVLLYTVGKGVIVTNDLDSWGPKV